MKGSPTCLNVDSKAKSTPLSSDFLQLAPFWSYDSGDASLLLTPELTDCVVFYSAAFARKLWVHLIGCPPLNPPRRLMASRGLDRVIKAYWSGSSQGPRGLSGWPSVPFWLLCVFTDYVNRRGARWLNSWALQMTRTRRSRRNATPSTERVVGASNKILIGGGMRCIGQGL